MFVEYVERPEAAFQGSGLIGIQLVVGLTPLIVQVAILIVRPPPFPQHSAVGEPLQVALNLVKHSLCLTISWLVKFDYLL